MFLEIPSLSRGENIEFATAASSRWRQGNRFLREVEPWQEWLEFDCHYMSPCKRMGLNSLFQNKALII